MYIQSYQGKEKPIPPLPSGPEGPGEFGAYYTKLNYYPEWDKDWRISDHADVVVRFDNAGYKFVFQNTLEGREAIIWLELNADSPVKINIQ